jgi:hypothetical protein
VNKLLIAACFILSITGVTFGQVFLPNLNRVKEIKFLKTDKEEVQRILSDFKHSGTQDFDHEQTFVTDDMSVEVIYASGNCSDKDEVWRIPEWKVPFIRVQLKPPVGTANLEVDLTKLMKEKIYSNIESRYIYHSKDSGFAVVTDGGEVTDLL